MSATRTELSTSSAVCLHPLLIALIDITAKAMPSFSDCVRGENNFEAFSLPSSCSPRNSSHSCCLKPFGECVCRGHASVRCSGVGASDGQQADRLRPSAELARAAAAIATLKGRIKGWLAELEQHQLEGWKGRQPTEAGAAAVCCWPYRRRQVERGKLRWAAAAAAAPGPRLSPGGVTDFNSIALIHPAQDARSSQGGAGWLG